MVLNNVGFLKSSPLNGSGALGDGVQFPNRGFNTAALKTLVPLAQGFGDVAGHGFSGLLGDCLGQSVGFGSLILRLTVFLFLLHYCRLFSMIRFFLSLHDVILKYNSGRTAMHTTNLRKVGGSVMLAVPPALLDILHLQSGAKVGIAIESGRLVVEPHQRRRYTLDELLAQCKPKVQRKNVRRTKRKREWLDSKPVGGELI
jgi:antitoxin ChpS